MILNKAQILAGGLKAWKEANPDATEAPDYFVNATNALYQIDSISVSVDENGIERVTINQGAKTIGTQQDLVKQAIPGAPNIPMEWSTEDSPEGHWRPVRTHEVGPPSRQGDRD